MNPVLSLKNYYYGTRQNLPKKNYEKKNSNNGYSSNLENSVYYESNYNYTQRMKEERRKMFLSPQTKEKRGRNTLAQRLEKKPFKKSRQIHENNHTNYVPNLNVGLHQPEEGNNHLHVNHQQSPLRQRTSVKTKEWMSPSGNLTRNVKRLSNARGPIGVQTPKISMNERERRRKREERRMRRVEFSTFENFENKKTPRKRLEPLTPLAPFIQKPRTPITPNERSEQQRFMNSLQKSFKNSENENANNYRPSRLNLTSVNANNEVPTEPNTNEND